MVHSWKQGFLCAILPDTNGGIMAETVRTPEQLKADFEYIVKMFTIERYVMTRVVPKMKKADYEKLSTEEGIILPIYDRKTVDTIKTLSDEAADISAINASLSELAEELNISFDINPNPLHDEKDPASPHPPYLLAIAAIPYDSEFEIEGIDEAEDQGEEGEKTKPTDAGAYVM